VNKGAYIALLSGLFLIPSVTAHLDLHPFLDPINYIKYSAWIVAFVTVFIIGRQLDDKYKKTIFLIITIPVLITTFYLAGFAIVQNINAVTDVKGPIHWHADFRVFSCGEELDLINPRFPANKVGIPLIHEHNDNRIHVEGVVTNWDHVRLQFFFDAIGGELTETTLGFPTNTGYVEKNTGDMCGNQPGILKIYVNGFRSDAQGIPYSPEYILAPHTHVPPGDCIIIDFSPGLEDRTDLICETWEVHEWNYDNYDEKMKTISWRSGH